VASSGLHQAGSTRRQLSARLPTPTLQRRLPRRRTIRQMGPGDIMEGVDSILQQAPAILESLGPAGPLAFFGCFVFLECFSLPGAPFMMASGCLFGLPLGCAMSVLALTTAATLSFFLARTILKPQLKKLVRGNQTFEDINTAVQTDGFKIIFLLRLAPLLPFALSNYAYGLSTVSFVDFFLATMLGTAPGTCATVYIATTAASMASDEAQQAATPWYVYAFGLAATVFLLKTVTDVAQQAVRKSVKSS